MAEPNIVGYVHEFMGGPVDGLTIALFGKVFEHVTFRPSIILSTGWLLKHHTKPYDVGVNYAVYDLHPEDNQYIFSHYTERLEKNPK